MNEFILVVCKFLDKILNQLIGILFFVELCFMVLSIYRLNHFKNRIKKMNGNDKKTHKVRRCGKGTILKHTEIQSEQRWDDIEEFCKEYQEKTWVYSIFSLFIQLFTLLGILGTVAGLYIALNSGQDINEGVKFALSTTVLGILFAVIYKVADILIISFCVDYIEDGVERYEKNYKEYKEEAAAMESVVSNVDNKEN